MSNMSVNVAGVEWKNPVTVASGTFGSGAEYSEFVDLNRLGAVTTKGVANKPWEGNPTPRVAEVYGGMLNAVGLQNPGIELFCKRDIPFLKQFDTRIVVNVCGHSLDEYLDVVKRLADEPIDMMEINISCPNVKEGGIAFGTDPKGVETITSEIKKYAKQPVIMKLSPNVTSIAEIARAAEAGGADAVSLINTITGMKIDINRRSFVLANKTGGMSGPAVHPVAVRMVYETAHAVNIPIIGMGGITNAADAIEMILAGATAVSVGTANFVNPKTTEQIVDGIAEYMDRYGVKDISELVAAVEMYRASAIGDDVQTEMGNTFFDWGIPAPVSLQEAKCSKLPLIASGGILDGTHVASAIAMGAAAAGCAHAVLREATESAEAVKKKLSLFKEELKVAMMLTGSANIKDLAKARYIVLGETRDWMEGMRWTQNSI